MRHLTRTLTSAVVALPLAAAMAAPSMAAPPTKYTESGEHLEASGKVLGDLDGFAGNVHLVSLIVDQTDAGDTYGWGYIESWACPEGVTDPWISEDETACESMGYVDLESWDADVTVTKKITSGTLSGTFATVSWECDEWECSPTYGTDIEIDLAVSAEGKAATYRATESFRDPETGLSYRGTTVQKRAMGPASGTVGGAELTDPWGLFGTFTFRSMEKY